MEALPPRIESSIDRITGLACPECPGTLTVRAEEHGETLRFTCRIGHVYSLDELIQAKERRAEDALWRAVLVFEELTALFLDLTAGEPGQNELERVAAYQDRIERTRRMTAALRALVEQDRPVDLGTGATTSTSDAARPVSG